ncbi:MAG TPA: hypothetical protein VGD01_03710 [Candidatus Elarobacter sp.]
MIRLGNKVFSSVLACTVAVALAACGGRGSQSALPSAVQAPSGIVPASELVAATFTIKIPAPTTTSATARRPAYISAATKSVRVNMTANAAGVAITSQFNTLTQVTNPGTAPAAPCTGSGPWTCVITVQVPPGSDTFTFTTYDDTTGTGTGASHILSQQIQTLTVVKGKANALTVTFDANTGTVNVLGSQPCQAGTVIASSYGSVGTSAVNLNVQYLDLAGQTIIDPGKPDLSVFDSTSGTYKTTGTINGTSGHADFTVNSSAQTLTLTPSSSTVTGVTVNVKATPKNSTGSSDGLPAGGVIKSFTFSTGPAPGSGFMAAIESTGAFTGQVDLFTVTLVNGGTDQINPYVTSGGGTTLARTASLNESGHFDVDNPEGLQFDVNGDLLIANGGSTTGGDNGNLACVPAGSIATGLANATTNSQNVDLGSPQNPLAYLTDGTAVLANNPTNATVQAPAFTLSGNYVYSATRSYTAANYGAYAVLALPTGTTGYSDGSYAVALTNGIDNQHVDPNPPHAPQPGNNKITIVQPNGTTTDLTNTTGINEPFSIAWDPFNHQLVVGNQSSHTLNVAWFTLSPFSMVKSINTNLNQYLVATAGNGYTAVAGASANGEAQIQIFDNNSSARNLVGIIPYNYFVTGCSGSFAFPASVVTSMLWLSNTKLLVGLKTSDSTKRGLYIYDINQTQTNPGCDDQTGTTEPNGPKATVFHQLTNTPLGTAYKP